MEYYLALERKEILIHGTTHMKLATILNKPITKEKILHDHLTWGTCTSQIHRDRKDGDCQGLGEVRRCSMDVRFQFGKTKKFWKWTMVMFTQCQCTNDTKLYPQKWLRLWFWGFPWCPVVKTLCFHCRGTKILNATWPKVRNTRLWFF